MAKKQATKRPAKPAAKPAKKAVPPPVTMKEIEDSSLFSAPADVDKADSDLPLESSNHEGISGPEAETKDAVNERDLQPVQEPVEDHASLPDEARHDEVGNQEQVQEPEPEPEPVEEHASLPDEARHDEVSNQEQVQEPEPEPIEEHASLSDEARREEEGAREQVQEPKHEPASTPLPGTSAEASVDASETVGEGPEHVEPAILVSSSTAEKPAESRPPDGQPGNETSGKEPLVQPEIIQGKEEKGAVSGLDLDDESFFESKADLEEIFSAMADVKKDEAIAIASAVAAIESGQDAASALKDLSSDVADKIQKQLEERSIEEEEAFVTEEEFIQHARNSQSKTWYHCLYFLAFNSESGTATKKVMYDALKETLSTSPVDPMPEHMFNFGLSALVKVMLYDKPVVSFKRGGVFSLETNRKKLKELLLTAGMPMSRRPVVTKKEEKKMISDFFENDKLF